MHLTRLPARLTRFGRRLRDDRSGLALIEFAFTLPIVLGIGGYGIEVSALALANLRVSQIALALADNASRVGANSALSTQQLREVDINDILQAVRVQGDGIDLTTRGRVILSSLENVQQSYDTAPVQRIHWQRCIGLMGASGAGAADYRSHYDGTTPVPITAGSDATQANSGPNAPTGGMGDAGSKINAPAGGGVMFVEINYQTKPLFGSLLMSAARVHYTASFIVRDNREFKQLFNPSPAVATSDKLTCNRYTT